MCTVTIVPRPDGFRLMCNRDERRMRVAAKPPAPFRLGRRLAAAPTDPEGGGTWIGVNESGLAVALLNRHEAAWIRTGTVQSRGLIVTRLLACGGLDDAVTAALAVKPSLFAPFRVVLVHRGSAGIVASDGCSMIVERRPLTEAMLFTSSSLGDGLVDPPRRQLFTEMVAARPAARFHGQARFHRHQWARHPDISVRMERADALTVSRSTIDVSDRHLGMLYETPVGDAPGRSAVQWCSLR
jgi:hypothetical protein